MGFFMLKRIGHLFQLVNILSLDVAVGAAVSASFLARVLGVSLLPQGLVVLTATVWLIYTADHLLDARKVKHPAASARHRFHQRNFRAIAVSAVVLALVDLAILRMVRIPIVIHGLYFSVGVGVYLLCSRYLGYVKELAAGLLYLGGVLLPAWALCTVPPSLAQWIIVSLFGIVVMMNLILFSWMSFADDLADSHPSLVTFVGPRIASYLLMFLFGVVALIVCTTEGYRAERWVLGAMASMLLAIFLFPEFFRRNDLFRSIGDAIFLFPLVLPWLD